MMAREQRLLLPFGRGHVAVRSWHADSEAMPVIAVHGWMDNAATFDRIAPLLSGHPLHAIDLPGHGLSDPRPDGLRYHNADYFDDLLATMDLLCPDQPVILLGHSLGAGMTLMLAGIMPERVHRLVLIEGLGPLAADPEQYADMTRLALESYRDFRPERKAIAGEAAAVQARMNGLTGSLSETAARILCSRSLETTEAGHLVWRTDKRLRQHSLMRFSEPQVLSCIRAITAPTLLIRGEQGAPFPEGPYLQRMAQFADLRLLTLPGGHHLHLDESPEAVAEAIAGFLAAQEPRHAGR